MEVAGRPMLAWSLSAFANSESVDRVVVAAPAGHEAEIEALVPADLDVDLVPGGETRSASVASALAPVKSDLVAVHDAARPLVSPELIDGLIATLTDRPDAAGAIAAAPIPDTVKRAREPRPARGEFERGGPTIAKTESRDHLWAAQTPQVFRTTALRKAHAAEPQRLAAATDDAMLVEKAGGKVLIHPWQSENLKVTTPADLRLAALLLAERR